MIQSNRQILAVLLTALWMLPLLYNLVGTTMGFLLGSFDLTDLKELLRSGESLILFGTLIIAFIPAIHIPSSLSTMNTTWFSVLWFVAWIVSLQGMREWMHLGGSKLFNERYATDLGSAGQFILIAVPVIAIILRIAPQTEIEGRIAALMERHIIWKSTAWAAVFALVAFCIWAIIRGYEAAIPSY